MSAATAVPRSAKIITWIARIWSIIVLIDFLIISFSSDPYPIRTVPAVDSFLLGFYGVAILGLLAAWRWKLTGGIIAVGAMLLRELAWEILKGNWMVNFLIMWAVLVPPGILFLVAWALERRGQKISPQ